MSKSKTKKAKVNEIEKIINGADFGRVPEKSYGTWYKKSLRRKLRALVRLSFYQGQSTMGDKDPVTSKEFKEMFGMELP